MSWMRITAFYPAEGTNMPSELYERLVAERQRVANALGPFDYAHAVVERYYRGGLSGALQAVDENLPLMSEPDRLKMCHWLTHLAFVFVSEAGPEDDTADQWMGRLARQTKTWLVFVVPDAPEIGPDGTPVHSDWLAGQIARWDMANRAAIITAQQLDEILCNKRGSLYQWLRTFLPVACVSGDVTSSTGWASDAQPGQEPGSGSTQLAELLLD